MTRKTTTRRSLLKSGAALTSVGAIGSLAGCGGNGDGTTTSAAGGNGNGNGGMTTTMGGNGNGNGGMTTTEETTTQTTTEQTTTQGGNMGGGMGGSADINDIPAAAEAVITIDSDGMVQDAELQQLTETFLTTLAAEGNYQGPTDVETILQQGSGLDSGGIGDVAMYMQVTGQTSTSVQDYFGMLLYTGFTETQLRTAIQQQGNTNLTQETYNGRTIYVANDAVQGTETVFAATGDGTFVVGTRAAAEDAIDVATGSGNSLSGSLRNRYQSTGSGYLRFASVVPQSQMPSGGGSGSGSQIRGLDEVQAVSGRFYTPSSAIAMDVNMHTSSSSAASELSNSVDSLLGVAQMQVQNQDARDVIDAVSVSASGTTTAITYRQSVSQIETYVQTYANSLVGMGFGGGMGGGMGSSP